MVRRIVLYILIFGLAIVAYWFAFQPKGKKEDEHGRPPVPAEAQREGGGG